MKKQLLKALSLICMVSLLFNLAFTGAFTVVNADGANELTVVKGDGTDGNIYHPGGNSNPQKTFDGSAVGWRNNQIIKFNENNLSVNLSSYDTLEIEFYYSSQSAYQAWLPHLDIQLRSNHVARYPMPADLQSGQWNTITLDLDVARNQINLAQCLSVVIKSHSGGTNDSWRSGAANGSDTSINEGYTDSSIADFTFRTRKIVAKKEAANANVFQIPFDKYRFWGQVGKTFDYATYTEEMNLYLNNPEHRYADISQYDRLEFDYYINDVASLKALVDTNGKKFWTGTKVELISRSGLAKKTFELLPDSFTENGYTHFSFDISSIHPKLAKEFKKLRIYYPDMTSHITEFNTNYVFGIVNIKAVKDDIDTAPAMPSGSTVISQNGKKTTWGAQYCNTQDRVTLTLSPTVNINNKSNVEFDIYIESYDDFVNYSGFYAAAQGQNLRFVLSSHASNRFQNRRAYNIFDKIKHSGWNHIVIHDLDDPDAYSGTLNLSSIHYAYLTFWSNSTSANPIGNTYMRIAGICATNDSIDRAPAMPDYALAISEKGKKTTWGTKYSYTQDRVRINLPNPVGIGDAKRVEFDLYIDNYSAFASAANGHTLRFAMSSDTSNFCHNRRAYNIYNKITKSGWNHIVIDDLDNPDAYTGTLDLSNIRYVYLTFWSNSSSTNPIANVNVKISGICATDHLQFGMNMHNAGAQVYPESDLEDNLTICDTFGSDIIRYNSSCWTNNGTDNGLININAVAKTGAIGYWCRQNGLKLMLVVDMKYYFDPDNPLDANYKDLSLETKQDILYNRMYNHFKTLSNLLQDNVDYYQLFNETDIDCMLSNAPGNGSTMIDYDCSMVLQAIASLKGAIDGINDGHPDRKTCINFGWWHTAIIDYLHNHEGYNWDITGVDWYSDQQDISSIETLMEHVNRIIPDGDIMICETNYWTKYAYSQGDGAEVRRKKQAVWVPRFMDTVANIQNPHLKAVMFYELLDETNRENNNSYNGEAHFGFIACDRNGGNKQYKPVFNRAKLKIESIKGTS